MRKTTILLLLLVSSPIFAEEQWRASALRTQHGYSAAIAYAPSPAWDIEAAVGEESFTREIAVYANPFNGVVAVTLTDEAEVHPADLFVTRRFAVKERLSPYVRVGARYVDAPGEARIAGGPPPAGLDFYPVSRGPGNGDRLSAQAAAGVRLRLTPRTALRLEAARLLREEGGAFDPLNRVAAGFSWQF